MSKRISQAELDVMEVVWAHAPITSGEIAARLSKKMNWSDQTIRTLLSRLVEKNAVDFKRDGRRYIYSPILSREVFSNASAIGLIDTLFGGRAAPLLAQFVSTRGLTQRDIDDIEQLLKELKRDAD